MLYPLVDAKIWTEKYEISTKVVPCPKCSCDLKFERPIANKKYRGLEVGECRSCGFDSKIFRVVPVCKETAEIWNSLQYK